MMKKHRKGHPLSLLVICLIALLTLTACNNQNGADDDKDEPASQPNVSVGALKGPTGMGMAPLMEENSLAKTKNTYDFMIAGSPDQMVAGLTSGELDIAAVPSNMAATLYQKTEGQIRVLAINTLGVLSLLEKGNEIESLADLKGKTIVASGQGSTAEYILNYLLTTAGLTVGQDVTVEYKSEHTEATALAQAGQADIVLLPEPFATVLLKADAGYRVAVDITDAWEEQDNGLLPMGTVVVRNEFYEEEPALVTTFLQEYAASVETCNNDIEGSAALIAKYDIMEEAVAVDAIPRSHIVYITGTEMQEALLAFYEILLASNAQSVGGALPGDDFYITVP